MDDTALSELIRNEGPLFVPQVLEDLMRGKLDREFPARLGEGEDPVSARTYAFDVARQLPAKKPLGLAIRGFKGAATKLYWAHPEFFTVLRDLPVDLGGFTGHFAAIGNHNLLKAHSILQVRCSRRFFACVPDRLARLIAGPGAVEIIYKGAQPAQIDALA